MKNNNKTYSDNLKSLLMSGFKEYYDDLNKKTVEEFQKQEKQQKDINDKLDNYETKINTISKKVLFL